MSGGKIVGTRITMTSETYREAGSWKVKQTVFSEDLHSTKGWKNPRKVSRIAAISAYGAHKVRRIMQEYQPR